MAKRHYKKVLRNEVLMLKVTKEEKEKIFKKAFESGLSFSQWARIVMLKD